MTINIVIIVSAILGFTLFARRFSKRPPEHAASLAGLYAFCLTATIVVASVASMIFSPGVWLFYRSGAHVFEKDGRLVTVVPDGQALWGWSQLTKGREIAYLSDKYKLYVGMKVQPITANPKVRELAYTVELAISNNAESMSLYVARFGAPSLKMLSQGTHQLYFESEEIGKHVQSLLYEFNEYHSKELSKFYNPFDEKQQQEFGQLLRTYVEKDAARFGLEIREARFSLP
ncbi:MAG: hypothetical protein Q7R48_04020 [bacterium]|nr:hypothetical protein [bacterium]